MPSEKKYYAKKHLGQHFLINPRIKQRILDTCQLRPDDVVLEIGPGAGALTLDIAQRVRRLYAVEKDPVLYAVLKAKLPLKKIRLFQADFLTFDLRKLTALTKIIGNLPYNIASPILAKLLEKPERPVPVFVMLQYEFAKRIAAQPHTKDYGPLSCFVQYFSRPKILFHIKPAAFQPKPKVMSSFVCLEPRIHKPQSQDVKYLMRIIHQAFQQRRKTIANALNPLITKNKSVAVFAWLDINPNDRPEDLSLVDYVLISNLMRKL